MVNSILAGTKKGAKHNLENYDALDMKGPLRISENLLRPMTD